MYTFYITIKSNAKTLKEKKVYSEFDKEICSLPVILDIEVTFYPCYYNIKKLVMPTRFTVGKERRV